jgi:hypothetical protein
MNCRPLQGILARVLAEVWLSTQRQRGKLVRYSAEFPAEGPELIFLGSGRASGF